MPPLRLVTLNPGHFHAALIQKEMLPGVDHRVTVYAPPGPDLDAHLKRIEGFNTRAANPTSWELDVRASDDWRERFRADPAGDIAVIAGRNRGKIDLIRSAVDAGLHVLADKPWIIEAEDFPKLEATLDEAERRKRIAYDVMTERYEITSILQRALLNDPEIGGHRSHGTADQPGLWIESTHYLQKLVAGQPLRRPEWFFDTAEQGEALPDVGTHLVDLAMWITEPGRAIDYGSEIRMLAGERSPVRLSAEQYRSITGQSLAADHLDYWCNNVVRYRLGKTYVRLDLLWDVDSPGTDIHHAAVRGYRSDLVILQKAVAGSHPELFVRPRHGDVRDALDRLLQGWPGVRAEVSNIGYHVVIPDEYRVGHEAHFARVANQFLRYVRGEEAVPAWERPNMLAKYFVTTAGVAMARRGGGS